MFVTPLSSSQVTQRVRARAGPGTSGDPGDPGTSGDPGASGPPGVRPSRRRVPAVSASWGYLGVGLAMIGLYYLLPAHDAGRVARVTTYCAISASAGVAVLVAVARRRPVPCLPWLLLGASQVVYATGDTTFYTAHYLVGNTSYPAPSDGFYLSHYPLVVVGLALLVRRRTPGRDRPGLLDAATIAIAATMLSWLFLISPSINASVAGSQSLSVEIVSVAYPVMDLAVLAVALRLVFGAGDRPASFVLLVGNLAAILTADTLYVLQQLAGTYHAGNYLDAIWLSGNLLLGAAALHPTMGRLARRPTAHDEHLANFRLIAILVAGLVAPAVLFSRRSASNFADVRLIAATCAAIFILVTVRMYGLASRQRLLAITDGLTGLHTRRFLETQLPHEVARALRAGSGVGLFIVDVDHFKSINDRYGHPAGDRALGEIASRLQSATRSEDVLARYGGEEFALLAPRLSVDDLPRVAERLREEVASRPIAVTDDVWVAVTVSVGAACYPLHAADEDALISVADSALYAAKAAGRNRIVVGGRQPGAGSTTEGGPDGAAADEAHGPLAAYLYHVADEVDARLSHHEHARAVGRWAGAVARELRLDAAMVRHTEQAGRLHDIGKIIIPRAILAKPAALSDDEWVVMRAHPEHGARLARLASGMGAVAEIISQHHERFGGGGYPAGIAGTDIRIEARIIAVCDSWAAMRADRAYEAVVDADTAVRRLLTDRETAFDPRVLDAFLALYRRGVVGDLRPPRRPA
jgi:diguanylate cyclase (GGDEF)-like protein